MENSPTGENPKLWIGHSLEKSNDKISIDPSSLKHLTLIFGNSGSGKTVLGKTIIEEVLYQAKIPVFAIDTQGELDQLAKKNKFMFLLT